MKKLRFQFLSLLPETAHNGWSRDVMMMQIGNGYINAKGHAINNFDNVLPPPQSDLARYILRSLQFQFFGDNGFAK